MAAGLLWEQIHRHRRSLRDASSTQSVAQPATDLGQRAMAPRLQLVAVAPVALPDLNERMLSSVRFGRDVVELDFSGYRLSTAGLVVVAGASSRLSNLEAGWRDALCSAIGSRVQRVRPAPADRFEIQFENGAVVLMPRTAGVSNDEPQRRINES